MLCKHRLKHFYLCGMLGNSKPVPIFSLVQYSASAAFQSISNADLATGSLWEANQFTDATEGPSTIHSVTVHK